jgi:hypothetical protein
VLRAEGVASPKRMIAMLLPGFGVYGPERSTVGMG